MPSLHADLLDHQAQQPLALLEVEGVETIHNSPGEVADALTQTVVFREFVSLGREARLLILQLRVTRFHLLGSTLHLGKLDEPGLVEVDESTALRVGRFELALEARELGAEKLVVGRRRAGDQRVLAGEENVGTQQRVPNLVEHERVELVGADVAFGTAPILAAVSAPKSSS